MRIGIDASRALINERTGIEEYSYQVISRLEEKLKGHQVVLYIKKDQNSNGLFKTFPANFTLKVIPLTRLWTQVGLSIEMLFHPVDVLFIPSHTVPLIHPEKTVVTMHGLEFEVCPEAYSFWERIYMRLSIRHSCRWAKKIIAVSQNTKKDLIRLYHVPEGKIEVIYEGISNFKFSISNQDRIMKLENLKINSKFKIQNSKFLLFIGRLEERKNVIGIIKAFEILKEHYKIPHKLVLAGKFGYGGEKIKEETKNVNCPKDIILTGFVDEATKWELLERAEVFLFPTFYEGFGLPILEAQSVGTPVVASRNSSIPEVVGGSAVLIDPMNAEEMADAVHKIMSDENYKKELIEKGKKNVQRFSWDKCADKIAETLSII